jgi:threonine/homoserine/homoserine lactone efflux protein
VVLGVVAATVVWSTLAAAGLGAALTAILLAAVLIRVLGGAYLAWFGLRMRGRHGRGGCRRDLEARGRPDLLARGVAVGVHHEHLQPKVIALLMSAFRRDDPADSRPALRDRLLTAVVVSTVWWGCRVAVPSACRRPRGFLRIRRTRRRRRLRPGRFGIMIAAR